MFTSVQINNTVRVLLAPNRWALAMLCNSHQKFSFCPQSESESSAAAARGRGAAAGRVGAGREGATCEAEVIHNSHRFQHSNGSKDLDGLGYPYFLYNVGLPRFCSYVGGPHCRKPPEYGLYLVSTGMIPGTGIIFG